MRPSSCYDVHVWGFGLHAMASRADFYPVTHALAFAAFQLRIRVMLFIEDPSEFGEFMSYNLEFDLYAQAGVEQKHLLTTPTFTKDTMSLQ